MGLLPEKLTLSSELGGITYAKSDAKECYF